ncbi:MAG: mandelate racemase/muconate lactonizing enzyme family protein, partial [Burkholderiales bacterium]|nr:mandelate racemase/muconate lactonizing enzyme family protein [Anaerolineae bacterium]
MKISSVTPMVLGTEWRNLTYVKVETDEGLVGVGESRVIGRDDAVAGYLSEAIPRYVLGSDPFNIEKLVNRMFREDYGRCGE